jgi:predicted nucleotidyltransferase
MDRIIRKHHQETIEIITDYFKKEGNIQGLIIGGSIAHGFAAEKSDVDILLKEASKYPLAEKESKIKKFYAQFEAWK